MALQTQTEKKADVVAKGFQTYTPVPPGVHKGELRIMSQIEPAAFDMLSKWSARQPPAPFIPCLDELVHAALLSDSMRRRSDGLCHVWSLNLHPDAVLQRCSQNRFSRAQTDYPGGPHWKCFDAIEFADDSTVLEASLLDVQVCAKDVEQGIYLKCRLRALDPRPMKSEAAAGAVTCNEAKLTDSPGTSAGPVWLGHCTAGYMELVFPREYMEFNLVFPLYRLEAILEGVPTMANWYESATQGILHEGKCAQRRLGATVSTLDDAEAGAQPLSKKPKTRLAQESVDKVAECLVLKIVLAVPDVLTLVQHDALAKSKEPAMHCARVWCPSGECRVKLDGGVLEIRGASGKCETQLAAFDICTMALDVAVVRKHTIKGIGRGRCS
jgi:hypothetical protein